MKQISKWSTSCKSNKDQKNTNSSLNDPYTMYKTHLYSQVKRTHLDIRTLTYDPVHYSSTN